MTNLHLLGGRGRLEHVLQKIGSVGWAAIQRTCERVMTTCYPGSLYAGIDLRISPDFRHHHVLEVNAFGDLLPDVLCNGRDTYETEIELFSAQPLRSLRLCGDSEQLTAENAEVAQRQYPCLTLVD
jgi:hypothetical protein